MDHQSFLALTLVYLKCYMMINFDKYLMFIIILVIDQNQSVDSNVYPVKAELPIYLRALERIIHSAGTSYNKIDENFRLGLFLANVNIRSAILSKNHTIPKLLRLQLQEILNKNKVSFYIKTNFFKYMKTYSYENEDTWAERVGKFSVQTEPSEISNEYLYEKYSQWSWYERRVLDFENSVPSPAQSDACMITLAMNQVKRGPPSYGCSTATECVSFVEHGSEFGYALVHRVLFLLVAHYGRGCYVFSPELDDAFIDRLCEEIYEEANYIVWNKFQSPDLLMEQISTCSLAGHTKFLQSKWLNRLMKQQTPRGCFSTYLNTVYNRMQHKQVVCNGHVSGVAAAALSAVARYIIETFY